MRKVFSILVMLLIALVPTTMVSSVEPIEKDFSKPLVGEWGRVSKIASIIEIDEKVSLYSTLTKRFGSLAKSNNNPLTVPSFTSDYTPVVGELGNSWIRVGTKTYYQVYGDFWHDYKVEEYKTGRTGPVRVYKIDTTAKTVSPIPLQNQIPNGQSIDINGGTFFYYYAQPYNPNNKLYLIKTSDNLYRQINTGDIVNNFVLAENEDGVINIPLPVDLQTIANDGTTTTFYTDPLDNVYNVKGITIEQADDGSYTVDGVKVSYDDEAEKWITVSDAPVAPTAPAAQTLATEEQRAKPEDLGLPPSPPVAPAPAPLGSIPLSAPTDNTPHIKCNVIDNKLFTLGPQPILGVSLPSITADVPLAKIPLTIMFKTDVQGSISPITAPSNLPEGMFSPPKFIITPSGISKEINLYEIQLTKKVEREDYKSLYFPFKIELGSDSNKVTTNCEVVVSIDSNNPLADAAVSTEENLNENEKWIDEQLTQAKTELESKTTECKNNMESLKKQLDDVNSTIYLRKDKYISNLTLKRDTLSQNITCCKTPYLMFDLTTTHFSPMIKPDKSCPTSDLEAQGIFQPQSDLCCSQLISLCQINNVNSCSECESKVVENITFMIEYLNTNKDDFNYFVRYALYALDISKAGSGLTVEQACNASIISIVKARSIDYSKFGLQEDRINLINNCTELVKKLNETRAREKDLLEPCFRVHCSSIPSIAAHAGTRLSTPPHDYIDPVMQPLIDNDIFKIANGNLSVELKDKIPDLSLIKDADLIEVKTSENQEAEPAEESSSEATSDSKDQEIVKRLCFGGDESTQDINTYINTQKDSTISRLKEGNPEYNIVCKEVIKNEVNIDSALTENDYFNSQGCVVISTDTHSKLTWFAYTDCTFTSNEDSADDKAVSSSSIMGPSSTKSRLNFYRNPCYFYMNDSGNDQIQEPPSEPPVEPTTDTVLPPTDAPPTEITPPTEPPQPPLDIPKPKVDPSMEGACKNEYLRVWTDSCSGITTDPAFWDLAKKGTSEDESVPANTYYNNELTGSQKPATEITPTGPPVEPPTNSIGICHDDSIESDQGIYSGTDDKSQNWYCKNVISKDKFTVCCIPSSVLSPVTTEDIINANYFYEMPSSFSSMSDILGWSDYPSFYTELMTDPSVIELAQAESVLNSECAKEAKDVVPAADAASVEPPAEPPPGTGAVVGLADSPAEQKYCYYGQKDEGGNFISNSINKYDPCSDDKPCNSLYHNLPLFGCYSEREYQEELAYLNQPPNKVIAPIGPPESPPNVSSQTQQIKTMIEIPVNLSSEVFLNAQRIGACDTAYENIITKKQWDENNYQGLCEKYLSLPDFVKRKVVSNIDHNRTFVIYPNSNMFRSSQCKCLPWKIKYLEHWNNVLAKIKECKVKALKDNQLSSECEKISSSLSCDMYFETVCNANESVGQFSSRPAYEPVYASPETSLNLPFRYKTSVVDEKFSYKTINPQCVDNGGFTAADPGPQPPSAPPSGSNSPTTSEGLVETPAEKVKVCAFAHLFSNTFSDSEVQGELKRMVGEEVTSFKSKYPQGSCSGVVRGSLSDTSESSANVLSSTGCDSYHVRYYGVTGEYTPYYYFANCISKGTAPNAVDEPIPEYSRSQGSSFTIVPYVIRTSRNPACDEAPGYLSRCNYCVFLPKSMHDTLTDIESGYTTSGDLLAADLFYDGSYPTALRLIGASFMRNILAARRISRANTFDASGNRVDTGEEGVPRFGIPENENHLSENPIYGSVAGCNFELYYNYKDKPDPIYDTQYYKFWADSGTTPTIYLRNLEKTTQYADEYTFSLSSDSKDQS